MSYTNSKLVNYTKLSPNHSGQRNHSIDTVSVHCVVGQCSVETIGSIFSDTSRQASSNYGIGYDGRIGLYVEEKNRSWCTSSASNDNRAITIEVASDTYEPYRVNNAAYQSLIRLLADICKRNNIKKLLWKADKSLIGQVDKQNMTVHRWFANKSCPGDYLYNLHGQIAAEVNKLLGATADTQNAQTKNDSSSGGKSGKRVPYIVKVDVDALNIRKGPGTDYTAVGCIRDKSAYTIVQEGYGKGAALWGKLKSGAGWIALDYTTFRKNV